MDDIVNNKDVRDFVKEYNKEQWAKVVEWLCVLGVRKVREITGKRKLRLEELEEMTMGKGRNVNAYGSECGMENTKKDVNDNDNGSCVKWQQQQCKEGYAGLNNGNENNVNANTHPMMCKPQYAYKTYKTNSLTVEQRCKDINIKSPQLSPLHFNYNYNYTPSNILSPQIASSLSPHLRYSHLSPSSLSHYKPFYSKYIAS